MLKRFLRDPIYLFFVFAFPLIFLFIFGTIFGNSSDVNFNLALINHADNDFTTSFIEKFSGGDNQTFEIDREITDLEVAKEKMSRGEIDSIIELPESFGEVSESCQTKAATPADCLPSGEMKVFYDEGSPQAGQTISIIMSGILDEMNVAVTGTTPRFKVDQVSTGAAGLSQFDYTFAGLFSYVLMTMGIYTLSQQLPSEKKTGTLRRIKATPFRPWQLLVGLSLVYLFLTIISAALMIAIGVLMFDFQMRGSWLTLSIFSIISTLTMIGFGAIVAGAAKNENQATMASQLIAFPMMFLSGVFFPRFLMPDWLQNATSWIPLTPVGDGVRYITTEGAGLIDILPQLGLVAVWGVVAYVVAFKVFRWE
ncbi:MAG: ABC transporter permease [Candidatus Nomurabacteria bacterium]|nr:ABC transporter permease [Candidatus Nomurabacteria bacterium]